MIAKTEDASKAAALSKKYKCDVKKLIRCWKKGVPDFEIAASLGIDMLTILQVRKEITDIYERKRKRVPQSSFAVSPIRNPR